MLDFCTLESFINLLLERGARRRNSDQSIGVGVRSGSYGCVTPIWEFQGSSLSVQLACFWCYVVRCSDEDKTNRGHSAFLPWILWTRHLKHGGASVQTVVKRFILFELKLVCSVLFCC